MKRSRVVLSVLVAAVTLLAGFGLAQNAGDEFQGKYVRVSPDLKIYYEESGTGEPIIFIPGWTASTYYFQHQLDHFSQNYRAISYDPRSQGRSSKTLENNNHAQHGEDLKAFIDALELKDVVLVAHSAGCYDAYAYFRAYSTENIKAFVCIDIPPKFVVEKEGDWGAISGLGDVAGVYNGLLQDPVNFHRGFQASLFVNPPPEAQLNELVDMVLRTPTSTAQLLFLSVAISDYTPEAQMIDGEIPVLNVLADQDGSSEAAQTWLANNAPNTKVAVIRDSAHDLHVEFPGRFNAAVDGFLTGIE